MSFAVPFVNAREHYRRYSNEFENAITSTLAGGDWVMRQQLRDFEEQFAALVGVKYAVGVNSGYHALHLSLLAAGIGPSDEVVTVAHTFVATISAIVHCGATPILVDVGDDYNIDVAALERAITPRTKAILPVHLNGRMSDMTKVGAIARQHKLVVIEDAAQAAGATVDGLSAGGAGLTGCFSFYPFKILGCFGDGGAVTTNDAEVATAVKRLRFNGEDRETGEYHFHGYTALLDNVQAAVLSVKLRYLPGWIAYRRQIAARYKELLEGVSEVGLPHFGDSRFSDVYQNYVIRVKPRDELRAWLRERSVETLAHWRKPVWEHQALKLGQHNLPNTESICREVISLPMSAETTIEHVEITSKAIRDFFTR